MLNVGQISVLSLFFKPGDSHEAGDMETEPGIGWIESLLIYAAREPFSFLYYVLLMLSPLFCLSAYLSWKLSQQIEKKEQKRRKKIKKSD
ncbi:small integral membrane protein 15 [Eurytemora carolleeae]|uniref:small integral membrane protein 15 n=1 Tax=Eurytemora carolleeae TaxID=1294199 RepID=UPI000C78B465|nr:small integral membrane protein 15 [Eurytemora carolleeae]|eukprot:XP_023330743.1 small integral membrane protein 15-like [Eurytemora affinis]